MDLFFVYLVASLALATVDNVKAFTGDQKFILYVVIFAATAIVTAAELIARGMRKND